MRFCSQKKIGKGAKENEENKENKENEENEENRESRETLVVTPRREKKSTTEPPRTQRK